MGIVIESSAQLTLQDIGVIDTAQSVQIPFYKPQLEDSAGIDLNVEFQTSEPFSQYGVLGAIPFKNGMAQVGNFSINRNSRTVLKSVVDIFLPDRYSDPNQLIPETIDETYGLPEGSPQLKFKIGNW